MNEQDRPVLKFNLGQCERNFRPVAKVSSLADLASCQTEKTLLSPESSYAHGFCEDSSELALLFSQKLTRFDATGLLLFDDQSSTGAETRVQPATG